MKNLPKNTKMTLKFTEQEVKVMRDLLLHHPEGAELFERLGNSLRDYRGKERENVDRITEKSQREVQQESNQNNR